MLVEVQGQFEGRGLLNTNTHVGLLTELQAISNVTNCGAARYRCSRST